MRTKYYNARLIDAFTDCPGAVIVNGGAIEQVLTKGEAKSSNDCDNIVDCHGLALMPAFIDMHCHLRDPGFPKKETMETGMRAALKGGYSMLCAMANTLPIMDNAAAINENLKSASELKLTRLIQAAALGAELLDTTPTNYSELAQVTPMLSNDGKNIDSDEFMKQALIASQKYDFIISTHCEPEHETVLRDVGLLKEAGGNLHVGHISEKLTLDIIADAKARGLKLSAEVTPHHLFGYDMDYRVNPPIASKIDVDALIGGIKASVIDCLSTDHAPHTKEDKQNGAPGISNIEYAIGIFNQVFYNNGIALTTLSKMLSYNPATLLFRHRCMEGKPKMGLLKPGYAADLVLLDTEYEYELDEATLISRSRNTPFIGRSLRGKVIKTIVEGECRYECD